MRQSQFEWVEIVFPITETNELPQAPSHDFFSTQTPVELSTDPTLDMGEVSQDNPLAIDSVATEHATSETLPAPIGLESQDNHLPSPLTQSMPNVVHHDAISFGHSGDVTNTATPTAQHNTPTAFQIDTHQYDFMSNATIQAVPEGAVQAVNAVFGTDAHGNVQFHATYHDFPPEAQAAFDYALNIWSGYLDSSFAGETIEIDASWQTLGERVLGAAIPTDFFYDDSTGGEHVYYASALANHLSGEVIDPNGSDVTAFFSSEMNWYFGTDGHPPPGQMDFISVVLHEVGHGLGFMGLSIAGYTTPYDEYLARSNGEYVTDMSDSQRDAAITSDDLYWQGHEGTANNYYHHPKVYAPSKLQPGSSVSHTDPHAHSGDLMNPALSPGESRHQPSDVDLGILEDIGWDINPHHSETVEISDVLHDHNLDGNDNANIIDFDNMDSGNAGTEYIYTPVADTTSMHVMTTHSFDGLPDHHDMVVHVDLA